jgi:hypothetical protein
MWIKNVFLGAGILTTLVAGARATPPVAEPSGSASGRVVVVSLDSAASPEVFLLVDEVGGGDAPDGAVDRVFRLQVDSGTVTGLESDLSAARVDWTRSRVSVTTRGTVLTFGVGTDTTPSVTRYQGVGLAHSRGWRLTLAQSALSSTDFAALRTTLLRVKQVCHVSSGGPGADYCSVSGCSGSPSGCEKTCKNNETAYCGCYSSGGACCFCSAGKVE